MHAYAASDRSEHSCPPYAARSKCRALQQSRRIHHQSVAWSPAGSLRGRTATMSPGCTTINGQYAPLALDKNALSVLQHVIQNAELASTVHSSYAAT